MSEHVRITIQINRTPFHFETVTLSPSDFRRSVNAPDNYEVWLVVKDADPDGPLPKDDVQITGPVEIKTGQHYRVVPPGTFGAVSTTPDQLTAEIESLRSNGYEVNLHQEGGMAIAVFERYRVPSGFNKRVIRLLLKFPMAYPNGQPDMFWTDEDLLLASSGVPKSAESIEVNLGVKWRRFSWHPQGWHPATSNVQTFLEFVNNRLAKAE